METGAATSDLWHKHKDGSKRCLTIDGVKLSATRVLGFAKDITERKQAEEAHRKLEDQLRVSQKMEAIGSLAGGIAHDFNNLLTVILSFNGFALDGVREGDPVRDDLLEVKHAGERAAALTRQLLAFSRRQIVQPKPIDLNHVIAEIEKMLKRIIGEDIELVEVLEPDLSLTIADPGQVEQVFMNLVINARDAMSKGGKLTVETSNVVLDEEYSTEHVSVKPGAYVSLVISDTGCGMDDETQSRVFEPFFTTKEMGKGTGLGLSTVYGIVKQCGGNIWVYSKPGMGTTFKIYFPRALSSDTPVAGTTAATVGGTGTETILVVEDEEAVRNIAKRVLGSAGYTVLTASNGDEAMNTCEEYKGDIHLLLTDLLMAGIDGRKLADLMVKARPSLKVLFMSGYASTAVVHNGVLDQGTHFISKPFTAADFTRKVREALEQNL
jgi:signal transduction histidine kinase/CheY-like chemotaxis protein